MITKRILNSNIHWIFSVVNVILIAFLIMYEIKPFKRGAFFYWAPLTKSQTPFSFSTFVNQRSKKNVSRDIYPVFFNTLFFNLSLLLWILQIISFFSAVRLGTWPCFGGQIIVQWNIMSLEINNVYKRQTNNSRDYRDREIMIIHL